MNYVYLIIPFITVVIAQVLKFIIEGIENKKFNFKRLLDGSGGMPSSHSASVTSLTTIIALKLGIDSPVFAISLVFAIVVMYDAMGIRYQTGKQAIVINEIIEKMNTTRGIKVRKLNENVGHKPIEVFCGLALGIVTTVILYYFVFL